MQRGVIRPTTRLEAIARAMSMVDHHPPMHPDHPFDAIRQAIRYRLKAGHNGGKDPLALHPASWSFGKRVPTCDCVGFVAWAQGWDRYQPVVFEKDDDGDPIYGGWINTDSMLMASRVCEPTWFKQIVGPEAGCLIVTGSVYPKGGKRKPGHVGLVVGPLPAEFDPNERECFRQLRVTHCSKGNDRKTGGAIRETSAKGWARRPTKFLRYLRSAE